MGYCEGRVRSIAPSYSITCTISVRVGQSSTIIQSIIQRVTNSANWYTRRFYIIPQLGRQRILWPQRRITFQVLSRHPPTHPLCFWTATHLVFKYHYNYNNNTGRVTYCSTLRASPHLYASRLGIWISTFVPSQTFWNYPITLHFTTTSYTISTLPHHSGPVTQNETSSSTSHPNNL